MSVLIDGINYELIQIFGIIYDELNQAEQFAEVSELPNNDKYNGDVIIPSAILYKGVLYSVTSIGDDAFCDCRGLTSITIPDSVTSIEDCAFYDCTGLTTVTIPNSVTSIGRDAFRGCTGLTSITIPDSITRILGWAFGDCTGLTSITIPNSVTSIGNLAFYGCTGLTSITIPDSVTSIGSSAFSGCTSLTSITIPDSVTSIGSSAFSGCTGLTSITIPDSVTSIEESAFRGCTDLTSITIPNSVTNMEDYAFSGCKGLTSITIPNSVKSIGNHTFYGCTGLISITIPNSVTSIGESAFDGCTGLTSIVVESGNKIYDSRSNCNALIEAATNTLIFGFQKTIIPNSVTSIGESAFNGCTGLTSITIPNSVESIGDYAFEDCTGLTSIVVESGNKIYDSRSNCNAIIETATNTLICGCPKTSIPNSVESIGYSAFDGCTGLTSITIPDSVTSIGNSAFSRCTGLTSITIPDSVTSIGSSAFSGCTGLTSITIPDSVTSIGDWAFEDCTGLTSITIPNSVKSIGNHTFYGCTGLTSITISSSVTSIGEDAFNGCTGLTSITIPDSITSIEEGAFYNCTGLTSITIPNSVKSIGTHTFYGCTGLTSITISSSVTSIGDGFFCGCMGLTSITIPDSVTSIGDCVFSDCTGLTSITISKSLSEIGEDVFQGCDSLQTIRVPKGMTETYCKMGLEPWRDKMVEPQQEEYTILLNIARGYELGIGMARNLAQAVLCYVQAADKGCAEAAYHLGELYEEGKGLPQDYQQAADWFAKSSQLYHPNGESRRQACLRIIEEENVRMAAFQEEQNAARKAQRVKQQAPINKPQKTILFFDTETNGLPQNYKLGVSATANWPRLIQLGWIITDESGNILKRKSQLIYPQSFTIAAEVTRLTGITTETARRNGVSLTDILQEFMADVESATLLVGHNIDFDRHIIGCELYRNSLDYRTLLDKPSVCTMVRSTDFCALPSASRYHSGYKYPTLTELYTKLFGHTFTGAHDALSDITATKDCYFELLRRGIL